MGKRIAGPSAEQSAATDYSSEDRHRGIQRINAGRMFSSTVSMSCAALEF